MFSFGVQLQISCLNLKLAGLRLCSRLQAIDEIVSEQQGGVGGGKFTKVVFFGESYLQEDLYARLIIITRSLDKRNDVFHVVGERRGQLFYLLFLSESLSASITRGLAIGRLEGISTGKSAAESNDIAIGRAMNELTSGHTET